jgi:hypothetical protein
MIFNNQFYYIVTNDLNDFQSSVLARMQTKKTISSSSRSFERKNELQTLAYHYKFQKTVIVHIYWEGAKLKKKNRPLSKTFSMTTTRKSKLV